ATLAWRINPHTEDIAFLKEIYPRLVEFADSWFDRAQDADGDGWPEWESCIQAGLRQVPAFVPWHPSGPAADVRLAETVDLASYLFRELGSLLEMGQEIGDTQSTIAFAERRALLRRMVEEAWSEDDALYRHRDRDTHLTPSGVRLGRRAGRGEVRPRARTPTGSRVLIWCTGPEADTGALSVHLAGQGSDGKTLEETLGRDRFAWFWDSGTAVSQGTFSRLERIVIEGVGQEFRTEARTVDLSRQDAAQLLPLWAGLADERRDEALVRRAVLDEARFWRAHGVPSCSAADPSYGPSRGEGGAAGMVWNAMIAESLTAGGWRAEAAELVRRLMAGVIHGLTAQGEFRELLDPDAGLGLGEGGHVAGLFPVWAFLEVLGVRLLGPRKVRLDGANPFPWPVEVRWRGLRVRREPDVTRVTFPDGQELAVPAAGRQLVSQEDEAAETRML
ncbi:MAG: MGH1-like glycoside hydrolase domain-containing protein, partial [Anaerolineales bacterium]